MAGKKLKNKLAKVMAFAPLISSQGIKSYIGTAQATLYGPPPEETTATTAPVPEVYAPPQVFDSSGSLILKLAALLLIPAIFVVGAIIFFKKCPIPLWGKITLIVLTSIIITLIILFIFTL